MNPRPLTALAWSALLGLGACASSVAAPAPEVAAPAPASGPGYSVSLVSISPEAGTVLRPGQRVVFSIRVIARLEVRDNGVVVLVLQDGSGATLTTGRPQRFVPVHRGTSEVTVTDTITIPRDIRQVQLFVVLSPEGYDSTTGEVVRYYPVRDN